MLLSYLIIASTFIKGTYITAFKFKDFYIVRIEIFKGESGKVKEAFLKYEKDKGYLWVEDTIEFKNLLVDKENKRLILLKTEKYFNGIHIYKMKIYEIEKRNISNYIIKTKIEEDSLYNEEVSNYYKRRNDTLFFLYKRGV